MAVPAAAVRRSGSVPLFMSCQTRQLEALQDIVSRRIQDPSLREIASTDDFAVTSSERGVQRIEHPNIAAALDVLNTYQNERKAKSMANVAGYRIGMRCQYKHDPRTRLVELLKRWLRSNAANTRLSEDEVRNICGLCRDVISCQTLFPSRNPRSFIQTIAEVYKRLQLQLREVLKRTRTCAELAQAAISLSRNLVSDAIAYLLVAATDLKQTDALPSLEAVALWEALPIGPHTLPRRADPQLQRVMKDAWNTHCGRLVATLLSTPWCVRLFEGAQAQAEASASVAAINDTPGGRQSDVMPELIKLVRAEFESGHFRSSGLAGAFRKSERKDTRQTYLSAVEVVFDLTYLLGEAFVQFSRISDGLGDYGMICAAPWLHPFLEALMDKVHRLKGHLENLDQDIDETIVLKRARGLTIEKPAPTHKMSVRAQGVIERAIKNSDSHTAGLLHVLQELRSQSAPERLPELKESLNDVVMHLDAVLSSPEFRARVGDNFPELPMLCSARARVGVASNTETIPALMGIPIVDLMEDSSLSSCTCTPEIESCDAWREASVGKASSSGGLATLSRQSTRDTSSSVRGNSAVWRPLADPAPDTQEILHVSEAAEQYGTGASGIAPVDAQFWKGNDPPMCNDFLSDASEGMQSILHMGSPQQECMRFPSRGYDTQPALEASLIMPNARRTVRRSSSLPSARSARVTESASVSVSDRTVPVTRLTKSYTGFGWRRHDVRALRLHGGQLDIFDKGSQIQVKTEVDIARDIDECKRISERVLSLVLRRAPKGAARDDGVEEYKVYFFEFGLASVAAHFHEEILRSWKD